MKKEIKKDKKENKTKRKYEFKSEKNKKMIVNSIIIGLGIAAIVFGLSLGGYKLYGSITGEGITKNASYCKSPYGKRNCQYARNKYVIQIQEKLCSLGYLYCTGDYNDGNFGNKTVAAVKKFQNAEKITADGWVGPITWGKLFGKTTTGTNNNVSVAFTGSLSGNTEKINIKIQNNSSSTVYYKWKTYKNDNLSWDKGKCLTATKGTTNSYATLDLSGYRYGRIYIYSNSSCSSQLKYEQTITYTKSNSNSAGSSSSTSGGKGNVSAQLTAYGTEAGGKWAHQVSCVSNKFYSDSYTYKDKSYGTLRVIASNKLSCGTIVDVYGSIRLENGTTYNKVRAIVLDNGDMSGYNLDLMVTNENYASKYIGRKNITYTVVRKGW